MIAAGRREKIVKFENGSARAKSTAVRNAILRKTSPSGAEAGMANFPIAPRRGASGAGKKNLHGHCGRQRIVVCDPFVGPDSHFPLAPARKARAIRPLAQVSATLIFLKGPRSPERRQIDKRPGFDEGRGWPEKNFEGHDDLQRGPTNVSPAGPIPPPARGHRVPSVQSRGRATSADQTQPQAKGRFRPGKDPAWNLTVGWPMQAGP